jgi:hypothetical protein
MKEKFNKTVNVHPPRSHLLQLVTNNANYLLKEAR